MSFEPIQNEHRVASDSPSTTSVDRGTVSRREVIKSAALISTAFSVSARAQSAGPIVYVGSYTGRGQGIYIYRQDLSSGMLTLLNVIGSVSNPSFLALDPQRRFLYAVNENANGAVSAFAVDPASGNLTFLNSQTSGGASPAHLSVHPSGKYVLVANYTGSTIEVIPVGTDGSLGTPTDLVTHSGPLGPNPARQDRPHPHMIQTDPSGKFILVNDLGLDKTFIYTLDLGLGKLAPNNPPFAQSTPGAGPRHFAFHTSGRWMFSINELNSTIQVYGWDSNSGVLQPIQSVSTLPDGFAGISTTAEVALAVNGNHIYGSNRGYDSIAAYRLEGDTGRLGPIPFGLQWTQGETPRHFAIDPSGSFLYAANQNTDNIAIFTVDPAEGPITPTGQFVPAGNPVCVLFLA